MSDENSVSGKPSFWTTIPGILTGLAALVAAATGLILALNPLITNKPVKSATSTMQPSPPLPAPSDSTANPAIPKPNTKKVVPNANDKPNPELESLGKDLTNLRNNRPVCLQDGKNDTWWDYFWDYGHLGTTAIAYARYLRKHPKNELMFEQLRFTFDEVAARNSVGSHEFDLTTYHSETMPGRFKGLLDSLNTPGSKGLSMDDERVFEAGIQNWYIEAGLKEPIEMIEAHCKYDK